MDLMTMLGVTVYFTIGWFLSEWLTKDEDRDEVAVFTFMFWPVYILVLAGMFVIAILMVIAVLVTKLMNPFGAKRDEGDSQDGSV